MENVLASLRALDLLSPAREKNGVEFISSYRAAINGARKLTGRDINNGRKLAKDHGNWLGALGYLIVIDIIGLLFRIGGKSKNSNNFIYTLKNFTNLDEKTIHALYALRCSFAHNFSLYNIPNGRTNKKTAKSLCHHFTVTQGKGRLVVFSKYAWDGKEKNKDNCTIINLESLGDLVEEINSKLIAMAKDKKLLFSREGNIILQERIYYRKR